MLPCSPLFRYNRLTHFSDRNNHVIHSKPCTRPGAYYPTEFPGGKRLDLSNPPGHQSQSWAKWIVVFCLVGFLGMHWKISQKLSFILVVTRITRIRMVLGPVRCCSSSSSANSSGTGQLSRVRLVPGCWVVGFGWCEKSGSSVPNWGNILQMGWKKFL